MKETPIIMSGEHPKLVMDGIKTQTRRVVRPQPTHVYLSYSEGYYFDGNIARCPYGQVGDRLWVRETFEYIDRTILFDAVKIKYSCDGQEVWSPTEEKWVYQGIDFKKMPSIFMPRWASRITLEITEVRVERLQEITGDDVIAEGYQPQKGAVMRDWWQNTWDSLNAKRGFGWEVNPWVWVITFKRIITG